jgi:hypothetical protein
LYRAAQPAAPKIIEMTGISIERLFSPAELRLRFTERSPPLSQ